MTRPFAAVAWDVDGTLVDSEPLHQRVLVEACAAYGVDVSDVDEAQFLGVHIDDVWSALAPRFGPQVAREAWLDRIIDRYVAAAEDLHAVRGAVEAMAALAGAGVRQVCVSNSNRRIVDANLRAIGMEDAVEFSISFDDVAAGKPDPEPYRLAAERLGLDPGRVVAVEDSATGARSAAAAGMSVIGLGLAADWRISSLSEVVSIVLPPSRDGARAEGSTIHGL